MMKKCVLIDPGIIPTSLLKKALDNSVYSVYIIQYETRKKAILQEWNGVSVYPFYCYHDMKEVKEPKNIDSINKEYNRVYNYVLSDYRTLMISERVHFRIKPWQNNTSDLIDIDNFIVNYLDLFAELQPVFLFFHSTPHDICSWVLGKVAEAMDIPVYLSKTTSLFWNSYLVSGISEHNVINLDYGPFVRENEEVVKKYYQVNTKEYDKAIPSYEKERINTKHYSIWSWRKQLKEPLRRPHRLVALFRKRRLFNYYQSIATSKIKEKGYIIVFLHYQPERTSLPEGQFFVQQLHLIKTLHLACPELTIYVKEHPSMFVGHFDIRYRNREFYKSIAEIENVELVNINIDSFSLLDHSLCIATITGTVGVQALIRGKAVLCFGTASYENFEGAYRINSCDDVKKAIKDIVDKKTDSEYNLSQITLDKLYELDRCSVNGIVENKEVSDFYDDNYRLQADGRVLYVLLTKDKICTCK